ncbi:MAG: hypothetical protein K0Q94_6682 [Paenibacillus sp.]|jgi:lysophospholipase L1-like esterase|nr:hypothetical protein [Paenibacillus sp.]
MSFQGMNPSFVVIDNAELRQDLNTVTSEVSGKRDKSVQITTTDVDFVGKSINLFDMYNPENSIGYYMQAGNLVAGASYYTSHSIKVIPGTQYTIRHADRFFGSFFTSTGEYAGQIGTASGTASPFTFIAPANAATMRVCGQLNSLSRDVVVEGTTYPSESSASAHYTCMNNPVLSSDNPLAGKRALYNGDSITAGAGWANPPATLYPKSNTGWCTEIARRNGMSAAGYAVSGGTIAAETYGSGGSKRHWICQDIVNMDEKADYIIFQGGINDYWLSVPLGTVTTTYSATLNDTTFCGGLESIFKQAQLKWRGKKIGFIITFKIRGTFDVVGNTKSNPYWEKAREICKKWSIPYLDLFNSSGLNYELDEIRDQYSLQTAGAGDGCHPNEAGYKEFLVPQIEAWMKTL